MSELPREHVDASRIQRSSGIDWPVVLRTSARWALVIFALYSVYWFLRAAGATLTPFIIGLVLAYLLLPIVKRLDRRMPRWASITSVYLIGLIVFELVLVFVVPPASAQVSEFVNDTLPQWFESGNTFVRGQIEEFNRSASDDLKEQVNTQVARIQGAVQENATAYAQRVGGFLLDSVIGVFQTISFLLGFLIIPFFLFYVLLDTGKLPGAINTLLHPRIRADFWNLWHIVDGVFGRYIRGQILLGLIIGSASFIGLTVLNLLGFEIGSTVLLAIIAGFGELIPVVGPILSAIPAIAAALASETPTSTVIAVIVLYVLIQQLENQILVPRIVGNTLKLHPAILMALLVIASAVGGLLLVILSAPLAAIARDMFIYLHRRLLVPPQPPEVASEGLLVEDHRPLETSKEPRMSREDAQVPR